MPVTTTEKMVEIMTALRNELYEKNAEKKLKSINRDEFVMLLSAVSNCRRWPLLSGSMDVGEFYHCTYEDERERTVGWLKVAMDIEDLASLRRVCREKFNVNEEYKHFWAEWHNMSFDLPNATPAEKFKMHFGSEFVKHFSDIIGEAGFYAWDCGERIGLCRIALAADIITDEEFWATISPLAKKAAETYNNWIDYGLSYLAGYLYQTYKQLNCAEDISWHFNMGYSVMHFLFERYWLGCKWYKFRTEYAIDKSKMKKLLKWNGHDKCIASNMITVDGLPVGYMYRETPNGNFSDSGWRFYQGGEDDDYKTDMGNSGMHTLNDICNYDPKIMPYLRYPVGTRLWRTPSGKFETREDF